MTPWRQVTATWDHTERLLSETGFAMHREAEQIQIHSRSNVIKLSSGAIVLKPVNDIDVSAEQATSQIYVIRLSECSASSVVAEIPRQRKHSELTGLTIDSGVATSGDFYMEKRITAGTTWSNSVTGLSAATADTVGVTNYGVDRLIRTTATHEKNTGYLIRLLVPGAALQNPDFLFGFEFGGPLLGGSGYAHTGYGQFYLALMGDGRALLYEKIDGAWEEVNRWRYLSPRDVPQAAIVLKVTPHGARFLEIAALTHADMGNSLIGVMAEAAYHRIKQAQKDTSAYTTFLHTVNNRGAVQTDPAILDVTGYGQPAVDVRGDLLIKWQISRLGYPASGNFRDRPFKLADGVGAAHIVRIVQFGYQHAIGATDATRLTSTLEQADGSALTPASETYTYNGASITIDGYEPPGGLNTLRAEFVLENLQDAGSRYQTPALVAYDVQRRPDAGSVTGAGVTGGNLTSFSSSGAGYDPDHETASLIIEDPTDALGFLRARGLASIRVETTFDPADQSKKAILFEGYTGRVTANRKGKTGFTYPAAAYRQLDIEAIGKWFRLQGQFFASFQETFSRDSTAPDGGSSPVKPWKVTDAIRFILASDGWTDDQLDIFDDDIRLFISANGSPDNLLIPPGADKQQVCRQFARDYLNAFFLWDANAGATGKWRLRRPPDGTETPVWNFTTALAASGNLAHRAGSYGTDTSPILGHPHEFHSYIVPPEGNILTVTGAAKEGANRKAEFVQRQIVNMSSFDSPTHTIADPNSIDYIGYAKPIEFIDHNLGADDPENAQLIVDFVARRVFNLACRGRKYLEFVSELVLIPAATLEPTVYTTREKRPLLPGDTVTIDGERCVIHSCGPFFDSTYTQKQRVAAELFRFESVYF